MQLHERQYGILEKMLFIPWIDKSSHGAPLEGQYQDDPDYFKKEIGSLNKPVWVSLMYNQLPGSSETADIIAVCGLTGADALDLMIQHYETKTKLSFEKAQLTASVQTKRYRRIEFYGNAGKASWRAVISDAPLNWVQRSSSYTKYQYYKRAQLSQ